MVLFRRSTTADSVHVFHLTKVSAEVLCADHYSPEIMSTWMSGRTPGSYAAECKAGRIIIAEVDGSVAGCVDAVPGEVLRLFIHPDYAGRGLGAELFEKGMKMASPPGQQKVVLEATLNAVPFYEKFGFRAVRKAYYSGDRNSAPDIPVVIMEKQIQGT